jgi:endoglucanase
MATEFGAAQALGGYDIMNEPNNMPAPTAWPHAAQAAIDAIRAVDKHTPLYIEGDHWSGAPDWEGNNPLLHLLTDKTCTNPEFAGSNIGCIVWSAHCYLDSDNSGTHFNWTAEVEAGVTVNTGTDRLKDFAAWIEKYRYDRFFRDVDHIYKLYRVSCSHNFSCTGTRVRILVRWEQAKIMWAG